MSAKVMANTMMTMISQIKEVTTEAKEKVKEDLEEVKDVEEEEQWIADNNKMTGKIRTKKWLKLLL